MTQSLNDMIEEALDHAEFVLKSGKTLKPNGAFHILLNKIQYSKKETKKWRQYFTVEGNLWKGIKQVRLHKRDKKPKDDKGDYSI